VIDSVSGFFFLSFDFRLKRLKTPFFSFFFSSLNLSFLSRSKLLEPRPLVSGSVRVTDEPSSLRSLGVREILRGSAVSSLKKESVFRIVPFLVPDYMLKMVFVGS
jgi:hypothetical protein